MTTEMLNYQQLLDYVNGFMKASGIRNFCRKDCKGACCVFFGERCPTSRKSCQKNTRLACSTWICPALLAYLYRMIMKQNNKAELSVTFFAYRQCCEKIHDEILYATEKSTGDDPDGIKCFTEKLPADTFDELHLRQEDVPDINVEFVASIKSIMLALHDRIVEHPERILTIRNQKEPPDRLLRQLTD